MNTVSIGSKERSTKLTSVKDGFDIASVRCCVERSLQSTIQRDKDLLDRLAKAGSKKEEAVLRHRMSLITDGYRVDSAITPVLAQLGVVLARALRLVHPLDVFVIPNHELNAYCLPSRRGNRLVMCLHSGLLAKLSTPELLFVMGHEVGHAILKHSEFPNVSFDNPHFSPLEIVKLRSLQRAAEISCDRFGLLACQDVKTACSALFKVASGLSDRWISFDEMAYSRHFDEIASMSELISFDDALRSHPLNPLRVKALISFSKSEVFAAAFGRSEWEISATDLEREIENMLSVIAPDFSELDSKDEQEAAARFLFDGALLLIGADGVVAPEEIAWLQARIATDKNLEQLAHETTNPEFRKEVSLRLKASCEVLVTKLPQTARAQLLKVICDVAVCAGGVVDSEFDILNMLREALDVPIEIARKLLSMAETESGEELESDIEDDPATQVTPPDGSAHPRPTDPLDAILCDARLPHKTHLDAQEFCKQMKSSGATLLFSVRALISWAIRSAGSQGSLSAAQAKKIITATIDFCCARQDERNVKRRNRPTSLRTLVRKHGAIVLFSRNETVFLGLAERPYVILSVSRVNNKLVIAPTDDLQSTIEVTPYEIRKDPNGGDWPDEFSNI